MSSRKSVVRLGQVTPEWKGDLRVSEGYTAGKLCTLRFCILLGSQYVCVCVTKGTYNTKNERYVYLIKEEYGTMGYTKRRYTKEKYTKEKYTRDEYERKKTMVNKRVHTTRKTNPRLLRKATPRNFTLTHIRNTRENAL